MNKIIDTTKLSRDYKTHPWKNGETPIYDDFYYLYVDLNLPAKEIQRYMGIKSANLSRTLRSLGIYKPKQKTLEVRKELNIQKFNSASPFGDSRIYQKGRESCVEKFGTDKVTQVHIKNIEDLNRDYWFGNFVKQGVFLREKCIEHHDITLATVTKYKKKFGIWEPNKPYNRAEQEICKYLYSLGVKFQMHARGVIGSLELDFFIPDYNLAIEYDGLLYHTVDGQFSKTGGDDAGISQALKTQLCREKGIALLKIFEDEWLDTPKKYAWKTKIAKALNKANTVNIQSLYFAEVDPDICSSFLATYGIGLCDVVVDKSYGLYNSNYELVHVYALTKLNKNGYLLQACATKGTIYVNDYFLGLQDIMKRVQLLGVLCDARILLKEEENILVQLGLQYDKHTTPMKYYFEKSKIRSGRLPEFMASTIIGNKVDDCTTEEQAMLREGYYRIYDSGAHLFTTGGKINV